ncbi:MAG: leucine-rich repeat protein [Lachnospiraceae bacterium]|nr:leucine-rich repeat protein [Lachnospiraceae bacterium]
MAEYIDDKMIVLDGYLLHYESDEETVVIPSSVNGMPIHTIGSGAFWMSDMKGVIISEGIRRIRAHAFSDCRNLRYVTIFPSVKEVEEDAFSFNEALSGIFQIMSFNESEYARLKAECVCDGGTCYMARELPNFGDNLTLTDAALFMGKVHKLPEGISRLYVSRRQTINFPTSFHYKMGKIPHFKNVFYPAGSEPINDERKALETLLKEGFPEPDPVTEQQNTLAEKMIRFEEGIDVERNRVFLFDDKNTTYKNGRYYIFGEHSIGYHIWQSLVPKYSNGKKFYQYRRCLLGAGKDKNTWEMDYMRFNVGYCDALGHYIETE